MDLNERFNVLVQGIEIAQRAGKLSLDNAVEAKTNIERIQNGDNLKESFAALTNLCEVGQNSGSYNLHDAHILFLAIDGINEEIDKFIAQGVQQQQEQAQPKQEIPVSVTDNKPEEEDTWEDKIPEEPVKKTSKRKK